MGRRRLAHSESRVFVVDDGTGLWGAQRYILRLAPFLRQKGHQLGLLSPTGSEMAATWSREEIGPTFDLEPGGQIIDARNDKGDLTPTRVLGAGIRLAMRAVSIAKNARRYGADVIVANSFWSHFDATIAGRLTGRRVVLYVHEECPQGLPGVALRFAVRLASVTIAVSDDVARSIGGPQRLTVVENGVDVERFSPGPADPVLRGELAASPDEALVVVLCRLDAPKQVDHVIRAVAGLSGRLAKTQLAVVGDATNDLPYANELRRLGRELLGERVRFLAPRDDVPAILRSADLYVLAGRHEGMPLGILEAQATGCPTVAYPAAGVRNSVVHGESGMLATANDWRSLRDNITLVLDDEDLRNALSQKALEVVREKFNLISQAAKVVDIIDRL